MTPYTTLRSESNGEPKMKKQTLADRIANKKKEKEARENTDLTQVEKRLARKVQFTAVKVYSEVR